MKPVPWILIVGFCVVTCADVRGQTIGEANTMMQAREFDKAAAALKSIVQKDPTNGFAWRQLGAANYYLRRYDDAVQAYKRADELGFSQAMTRYNIACSLTLDKRNAEALEWLEKAVASGFSQVAVAESDEDLIPLRNDKRFHLALEGMDKNANPCKYDDRRHALDFWVGSWDVFNSQGQKVGTNVIEKRVGDCVIHETWTSALGNTGQSINYLDPTTGKWKQNWVSQNGGIVWYEGEAKEGGIYFQGENIGPDGTSKLARVRLTPADGGVRHVIETSADGGKSWVASFEGTYRKKEVEQNR